MRHHLKAYHKSVFDEIVREKEEAERRKMALARSTSKQMKLPFEPLSKSTEPPNKKQKADATSSHKVDIALKAWDTDGELTLKIDRCVAQMISTAILPISFVESVGFRNLIANLQPRYRLKSRTHFSRTAIPNLYIEYVEKVKAELRQAHSLSITADGWSSSENTHSFLSLTAHFLDTGTMAPRFLIVGAIPLKGRHTAENMGGLLSDCLNKFSIPKEKVFCMMRDGASAMVATASVLGVDSGHCFAHIIHLAVKEAIATYPAANGLITSMKTIVRKVRKSDKSNDAFKQCLADCELPDRCLLPCIDVRWTSLYDMLKRYRDNKRAVDLFLLDHPKYPQLSHSDWALTDQLIDLLRPLSEVTTFVQGRYKASVSTVLPIIHVLKHQRMSVPEDAEDSLSIAKRSVLAGIEKRIAKMHRTPFGKKMDLATLLDPRFKAGFFDAPDEKRVTEDLALKQFLETEAQDEGGRNDAVNSEGEQSPNPKLDIVDPFTTFLEEEPMKLTPSPSPDVADAKAKARHEVDEYFAIPPRPTSDPYEFWSSQVTQVKFPLLRNLAFSHLSCPATSAESERLFSAAGLTITDLRTRLSDETVEKLLFLHSNIAILGYR
ncbi:hypothetical protein QR680_008142 [Steinernema hermaphroditum]|uniref:HAT C-terminal dimerisation domain-containing protein n=1 Tax=Steinernema hermaphroditum TaxID=289476 RepID=A0AA39IFI9_9BILA|nr:hypothetical protein QR680_008142 [Steinernema hermaphroditum]